MTAGGGNQSSTALVLYVWFPQGAEIQSETLKPTQARPKPDIAGLWLSVERDGPIKPGNIAYAAVFLASEGFRIITGHILPVDRGIGDRSSTTHR